MTLRTFLICSVALTIVAIATFLGITDTSDKIQTVKSSDPPLSTPSPPTESRSMSANESRYTRIGNESTTPSPRDQSRDNINDCLNTGREFRAGGLEIVSVDLRGRRTPQIGKPRTPQERKFNTVVRKLAQELDVGDEGSDFSALYATPEFVSVALYHAFCGQRCRVAITPVNFDLKAGKEINKLSELFTPGSKFLETIASYCVREFSRCHSVDNTGWFFKEGTKPTLENYDEWNLTHDGIQIIFPEHQVGSGVVGYASVVVPYSHLQGTLRNDVAWFRRL